LIAKISKGQQFTKTAKTTASPRIEKAILIFHDTFSVSINFCQTVFKFQSFFNELRDGFGWGDTRVLGNMKYRKAN